ncbi:MULTISPECIES: hypothetical protein [Peptoniphilus]|uniref:hypothetical protein n=1 Tax=Peptoniphilus TaxID=162289 RepID=UPI0002D6C003|nr:MULTISPECIES: hypothetical protein [Peptoniphilus]
MNENKDNKNEKNIRINGKFLKYFGPVFYILGLAAIIGSYQKKDIFLAIVGIFLIFWTKRYRKPYIKALEELENKKE